MRPKTRPLALAAALLLLVATGVAAYVFRHGAAQPVAAALVVPQPPATPPTPAVDDYAQAAVAFRAGDLEKLRGILTGLAERRPEERERALLVLGLHEYAGRRHAEAVQLLQMVADPSGELEGWRLFALADAASQTGDEALAEQALARLMRHPNASPLRGHALIDAAERAWKRGDTRRALAWIDLARSQPLARRNVTDLEVLAWRIGVDLGDRAIERAAARRLLVHAPVEAGELRVGDIFRNELGRIDTWDGVLTRDEVEERAAGWLAAGRGLAAASTLATIAPAQRTLRWHLLQAEALTQQGKGDVAYDLLRPVKASSAEELARLEWQRALAAADVAVARPGRGRPGESERRQMLEVSQQHLRRVVELNVDAATSASAVRKLYGQLAESGRFDQAMQMLKLLRHLDPDDRTGASHLWERGWGEYQRRNYTGAIGYWTQLEQIYPGDRETHRGRYWKARAFDALGQPRRATEIYRQLLDSADTADFYVRRAAQRLPEGTAPALRPGSLSPAWPSEPALRRVLVLSNFGLDALARIELDTLAGERKGSQHERDVLALQGILTVREGQPRQGVQLLRAAFPSLGGPFQASVPLPVLEAYYPLQFDDTIQQHARKRGLPPALVAGIIRQESAFDRRAESWAGARGLMQLMPATAKEWSRKLGVSEAPERLYDPEHSIHLGTAYFKYVLDRFDGNVELALAGYNGGPNRIKRLWREAGADDSELDLFLEQLGISESQAYVKRILVLSDSYRQLYPAFDEG